MSALKSHADVAEILALPLSTVIGLRKSEGWPHVRIGKHVRFTDEQVSQIIASHTTAEAPVAALAGQTRRSARSRAS